MDYRLAKLYYTMECSISIPPYELNERVDCHAGFARWYKGTVIGLRDSTGNVVLNNSSGPSHYGTSSSFSTNPRIEYIMIRRNTRHT